MADLAFSFEPVPGYNNYKVTAMLRDYLGMLMEQPENKETVDQILNLIIGYTIQLRNLRAQNRGETTKEVFKAMMVFLMPPRRKTKRKYNARQVVRPVVL